MLLALASSCGNDDNGAPLPDMTEIAGGELLNAYGFKQQDLIITNQKDWSGLVASLSPFIDKSDSVVDFNKFTVIAVFDALKGVEGYSVEITEVGEYDTEIIITATHSSPENETQRVVTQAFHIIKIPKSARTIEFEHMSEPPYVYFDMIGKGSLQGSGGIPKQDFAISIQADWEVLLSKMNVDALPDRNYFDYYPEIDFDEDMVIASFERLDCTVCNHISVDITDIIEEEKKISVIVQNLTISVSEAPPQPFHIVKIPRSSKPVVFIHK